MTRALIHLGLLGLLLMVAVPLASAQAQALATESPIDRDMRAIAMDLRCPVCQGENLYDSQSGLAAEMRDIIREQLRQGRSRQEIIDYFVARYGNYVRLAPGTSGPQLAIWLWPLAAGLIATILLFLALRRRERNAEAVPETAPDPARILDRFEVDGR